MATYEEAGTDQIYNAGVWRVAGITPASTSRSIAAGEQLFADLLDNKDIVGGQVAEGFVGTAGTPLKRTATEGVYEAETDLVTFADTVGVLLLAVDAYDAPRMINVVKGGTIKTTVLALKDLDDTELEALATALDGSYDPWHKTIKF